MRTRELRELTVEELKSRLQDGEEELFNLQFRQGTQQQLSNPLRIRTMRREIARMKTVLKEHELGIRKVASSAAP